MASAPSAAHWLRLHAAGSLRELWSAVRAFAREHLPASAIALRLPGRDEQVLRYAPPGRAYWIRSAGFACRGGAGVIGQFEVYRAADGPDLSRRVERPLAALRPQLQTALQRVLGREADTFRTALLADLLDDLPVGLLVLDEAGRPLWCNGEATYACSVWNHGERRAAALNPRRAFRVPAPLAALCAEMAREPEPAGPRTLNDNALGLHAQVTLRRSGARALPRLAFLVHLDYRRPRGDRQRPLSPGAVALLDRLSPREREVAMGVREGLANGEIASALRRSPLTIKTQLASIFAKLQTSGRSRVAALLNR